MKRFVRRDWRNVTIGLLAGLCLAFAFGAAGQDAGSERYKLHVWSADPPATGGTAECGAYRIDVTTGDVYRIDGRGAAAAQIQFPKQ
jgi:hypothetical protein